MDLFDVYVLRFDVNEERATRALMQVFGLSEAAARIFVHSVPRVGKRNVPTATAERYVRALHAVGAIVECRRTGAFPLGDNANNPNRVQPMSLPAPTSSTYPGASRPPHIMQDSLGIMGPLAYSPDMPQIPKAPRIPADLHAIRARKGPDSMAPNWRNADPSVSRTSPRAQTPEPEASLEAGLWSPDPAGMQMSSDPLGQLESPFNRRQDSPEPSVRQQVIDQAALDGMLGSPAPLSPSPFAPSGPAVTTEASPWFMNATHQLLLACMIIGGMLLAMSSGVFETDTARRMRSLQEAGIEAGEYESADTFLARSSNKFGGLPREQLQALTEGLVRAGVRGVWISNIARQGTLRTSNTLLIELPPEANARRAIFVQHLASVALRAPAPEDSGQRYLRLVF
jgi:hypothetical protein